MKARPDTRNPFGQPKHRSAVVLLDGDKVCLMERRRKGHTYYLFPGGGVEAGEDHERAAIREAKEELGLDVELVRVVADLTFKGARQVIYLATIVGGEFGTGTGPEMNSAEDSIRGSYTPSWLPLAVAARRDTRPLELVEALLDPEWAKEGVITSEKG